MPDILFRRHRGGKNQALILDDGTLLIRQIGITADAADRVDTPVAYLASSGSDLYLHDGNGNAAVGGTIVTTGGDQTLTGEKTFAEPIQTTAGIGQGANLTVAEYGDGRLHTTVIEFGVDQQVGLEDEADEGQFGAKLLYSFPANHTIAILAASAVAELELEEEEWADTAAGDFSLGTEATTNGGALSTARGDILASTEIAPLVAQAGSLEGSGGARSATVSGNVYLNVRIDDDAAHGNGNVLFAAGATIVIVWADLGVLST